MTDLLLIAIAAATINNVVLMSLLGLGPVLDPVRDPVRDTVLGPGVRTAAHLVEMRRVLLVTTGVLTITAGLSHLLNRWVLLPYELPYLRIIGFLALTVLTVQAANLCLRPPAQQLQMITTNCAVLGVMLLTTGSTQSLPGALALGFGAGLGFSVVAFLVASLRPRLEQASVPGALRGPAITLITLGMMSLAVLGFSAVGS